MRNLLAIVLTAPWLLACGGDGEAVQRVAIGGSAGSSGSSASGGSAGSTGGAGPVGNGNGGSGGAVGNGGSAGKSTAFSVEAVAPFRGATQGAYSIIHDDTCDTTVDSQIELAEPELAKRGLVAAFGAIVSLCVERDLWNTLAGFVSRGHEIVNHSWSHQNFAPTDGVTPAPDLSIEMDQATVVLDENLPDRKTEFFIFPYDSFDDESVLRLGALGYSGARAGGKGLNPADFPDGLRVNFDVYGGENSIYQAQGDIMKYYVDLAVAEKAWAVRELHGVGTGGWEPIPLADYAAHLDYVKTKADSHELWVATPSAVVRYRFARQHCGTPVSIGGTLEFSGRTESCADYSVPLSVIVNTSEDVAGIDAAQGGAALPTRKLGSKRFLVDVDPMGGTATLSAR